MTSRQERKAAKEREANEQFIQILEDALRKHIKCVHGVPLHMPCAGCGGAL